MVVGHLKNCSIVRIVGLFDLFPANRTVLAVISDAPETGLGCDQRLVAIVIVGEGLGRLGNVNLVGLGGDKVFGLVAVCNGLGERRVGFEIPETAGRGVVKKVAAEIIGAEAEGRVLVDRDRRFGRGFAAHGRIAGRGARRVLVEIIRLIGRDLRFALLVVGR